MNYEFKEENGIVVARKANNQRLRLIATHKRIVDGIEMTIYQVVSLNDRMMIYIMDRITMNAMSNYDTTSTHFGYNGSGSQMRSRRVFYNEPMLIITMIQKQTAYFVNKNLDIVAGSNVYPDSRYCLGVTPNFTGVHPVEAMTTNRATIDLGWRGDPLEGSWNEKKTIFNVSKWPTYNSRIFNVSGLPEMISGLGL